MSTTGSNAASEKIKGAVLYYMQKLLVPGTESGNANAEDQVTIFRKQKNLVCPSVTTNFVSKNTIANHVRGTVISVRGTCVFKSKTTANIFFTNTS